MVLPAFGVSIRRLLRILIGIDCTSFILDCTALPLALFWLTFDRGAALSIFRLEHTSFPLSHKPRCRYQKDRAASCTTRSRHPLLTSALHKAAAARATPFPHPSRSQLTLFRTIDFLQLLQYYCNTTAILLQYYCSMLSTTFPHMQLYSLTILLHCRRRAVLLDLTLCSIPTAWTVGLFMLSYCMR